MGIFILCSAAKWEVDDFLIYEQCPVVEKNDKNNLFGDLNWLETQGKPVFSTPSELIP